MMPLTAAPLLLRDVRGRFYGRVQHNSEPVFCSERPILALPFDTRAVATTRCCSAAAAAARLQCRPQPSQRPLKREFFLLYK